MTLFKCGCMNSDLCPLLHTHKGDLNFLCGRGGEYFCPINYEENQKENKKLSHRNMKWFVDVKSYFILGI